MSGVEFQLVKIQTCILKVHIHCEGCARKVKKVLNRIEGVYGVDINLEEQKVIVCGMVDSAKLIQKLKKSRKHAELWLPPIDTAESPSFEAVNNNNWITDGMYDHDHNTILHHHLMNGGHGSISSGAAGEHYTNVDAADIGYLMATRNNINKNNIKRASSSMENKDYYPPLDNNNNSIRSIIGFQDLASGESEFEDAEFPRHDNVLPVGLQTYPPPGMIMKMNSIPEEELVSPHQSRELINSPMPNFRVIPNTMVYGDGYVNHQKPRSHHQSPGLINSPIPDFRVIPNTMVYDDGHLHHQKPQIFMR